MSVRFTLAELRLIESLRGERETRCAVLRQLPAAFEETAKLCSKCVSEIEILMDFVSFAIDTHHRLGEILINGTGEYNCEIVDLYDEYCLALKELWRGFNEIRDYIEAQQQSD